MPKAMHQTLRHVLIALALVFAQQAAQSHALSHLGHDLASARWGEKGAPPVAHPAALCLLFHAVDSVLHNTVVAPGATCEPPTHFTYFTLPLPFAPRIEFHSRAPPALS